MQLVGAHEDIFAAALSADVPLLRRLLQSTQLCPGGRSPLWLAASVGHVDVVRVLLSEEVEVDTADATGNTPLMCAASQGYGAIVTLLLQHGASPLRLRQDGQNAVSLTAFFGRCDSLGAILRFDPSIVGSKDGLGRTALHWASIGGQALTAKYLIGRWGSDAQLCARDAEGNTPLHVCRGPAELVLLLLFGGGATPPVEESRNRAGLSPLDAAVHAGLSAHDAAVAAAGLSRPEDIDPRLFAFVESSALRLPPAQQRPPPWPRQMDARAWVLATVPSSLLLLLCHRPPAAAAAAASLLAVYTGGRLLPVALERLVGRCLPLCPACCHGVARRCQDFLARVPHSTHRFLTDYRHFPVPAALACMGFVHVAFVNTALLLPHVTRYWLPLLFLTLASNATLLGCYYQLLATDPGVSAGADPQHAHLYWSFVEHADSKSPVLDSPFCLRSELLPPVRARFSPLSRTLVKAFDHDCWWLGSAVGDGNHVTFFGLLLAAQLQLLLLLPLTCLQPLPPPLPSTQSSVELLLACVQLVAGSTHNRAVSLTLALTPAPAVALAYLLVSEVWQVACNVTTVERILWARARPRQKMPARGSPEWRSFAPFDRGLLRNLAAFVGGRRAEVMPQFRHQTLASGAAPS